MSASAINGSTPQVADREQAAVRIECAAQMNTLVARVKRRG